MEGNIQNTSKNGIPQEPTLHPCHIMEELPKEQLGKQFPNLYSHLSAAMREDAVSDLWPKELTRAQMKEKHTAFMRRLHKK